MSLCNDMDEILPGKLWIGGSKASSIERRLVDYGITSVVNCARGIDDPYYHQVIGYKFGFTDGTVEPENRLLPMVLAAYTTIQLIQNGEQVLLHCAEGISRSVSVGIVVVSYLEGLDLRSAWDMIGEKRPIAYPHRSLIKLLPDVLKEVNRLMHREC